MIARIKKRKIGLHEAWRDERRHVSQLCFSTATDEDLLVFTQNVDWLKNPLQCYHFLKERALSNCTESRQHSYKKNEFYSCTKQKNGVTRNVRFEAFENDQEILLMWRRENTRNTR